GKVRLPDSNERVQLAGSQALRVTVSPALLGDPTLLGDIKGLPGDLASVAETRVLGSSKGETVLGIGIKGDGDLAPQVENSDARIVIRIKHPPYPPADKSACGSVILDRPEGTPRGEASAILAKGTTCDIARDVAAAAKDHVNEPYGTPAGYSCRIDKRENDPTLVLEYDCDRADAHVSFTVS
ncbi:MAG: hypothetical protein WCC65_08750, partial [Pseudonocardiaceae bacterium]